MFWKTVKDDGRHIRTRYLGGLVTSAHSEVGGNVRVLGRAVYFYNNQESFGWFNQRGFVIPGLIAFRHVNDKGGTLKTDRKRPAGWTVRFFRIRFKFKWLDPEVYS